MTGHTPMLKVARLDVISSGARRRWTLDKQRLVADSYAAPRQVSVTARRNSIYSLRHFYASTHYAMGLACSRSLATWGPLFELFQNITEAGHPRLCKAGGLSWHTLCIYSGGGDFRAQF